MTLRPMITTLLTKIRKILLPKTMEDELLVKEDNMTRERHEELERNANLCLTAREVEQGYRFCCEFDGLLIHHTHPEAMSCGCLRECGYRIMTHEEWQEYMEGLKNARD